MERTHDFTRGPILGPLTRFALPIFAALLLQAMYGAVDLLVVGRFGTAAGVSAVATGSSLMQSVTGMIAGLSMGLTVLLGQLIGAGDRERAGDAVGAGIAVFGILGAALTAAMALLARPLCRLLDAPPEALADTVRYVRICSLGLLLIIAYNVFGGIFRGLGDARTPLYAVMIACAVNIGGDLLLVAVFHMGAAGAALATVFAQGVSVALSLRLLRRQTLPFRLRRAALRPERTLCGHILRLGAPIALQDMLVSVSFLCITAIVNGLGVVASAGVGVAEKLCTFIMLVSDAFMQALSAFVAQNIGARAPRRARRALWCGIGVSLAVAAVTGGLSFFRGAALASLFTGDPRVIAAAADYLRAYSIDTLLTAFLFCFIGYFNGCGRTRFSMAQGIVGAFCVRVPVSYAMSRLAHPTLFLVGLATPCSTAVQIVLCLIAYARLKKRGAAEEAALHR